MAFRTGALSGFGLLLRVAPLKSLNHLSLIGHISGHRVRDPVFRGIFFLPRGSVTRAPYFSRSLFWKLNPGERLPRITSLGVVM